MDEGEVIILQLRVKLSRRFHPGFSIHLSSPQSERPRAAHTFCTSPFAESRASVRQKPPDPLEGGWQAS